MATSSEENDRMPQHISRQFDRELEGIRESVLAMGKLVRRQLAAAVEAFSLGNAEQALLVIDNEGKANTYEISLDKACIQLLVRRQPAASDLRMVMVIIKVVTDLERIGDEATRIATFTRRLVKRQEAKSYYREIVSLGSLVGDMVEDALDAFSRMDSNKAVIVADQEPESDRRYEALLEQLSEHMRQEPASVDSLVDALWIIRSLERVGDHARNICEYVIYQAEGKDVRHISMEQMKKRVGDPRAAPDWATGEPATRRD
ncbi:MAG: phosphate signaling complex protein PhoU [Gammaproteobacteria bacterium]|nr:phosphate signaling complex protein PhoU [Gammaproteobacteria bacterium]